ncbi:MAG: hypothetical protein JJT90_11185 [Ectothiorhodospiraceae bacterium]|nr:hypothetical protein [Ectothiorhodospiraceae bacterium]
MDNMPVINFIHGDIDNWRDVAADDGIDISLDALAPRIKLGREIWIVQAFQLLRKKGYKVKLTGGLDSGSINVVHCDDIRIFPDLWRYFIVSVRADRDPAFVSQLEIVQNRYSVWSDDDFYIPHWPQPGLVPRDARRGETVENVVYMGKRDNLDKQLQSTEFLNQLRRLNLNFIIQESEWWDYREADVVLAVRAGAPFYLAIKPASKVVNAWHAGCAAIVNPEPGYREIRESNLDFLEAGCPETVVNALKMLKQDRNLYFRMINNGYLRAENYTTEKISQEWINLLENEVFYRYREWLGCRGRKLRYWKALIKRRAWGTRAVQDPPKGWRESLAQFRRGLVSPNSVRKLA